MSQVRGNPEEMRRFASSLNRFAQTLSNEVSRIDEASRKVGETWNDHEYQKFMAEWQQTLSVLKRFLNDAPQYERHVMKKASELEAYLRA